MSTTPIAVLLCEAQWLSTVSPWLIMSAITVLISGGCVPWEGPCPDGRWWLGLGAAREGCSMLTGGAIAETEGEDSWADDAACAGGCGSALEDTGTLCCETAACPRLARVDARLGGGGESSLSSLGIGLVRRLLRSLLPIVSMLSLLIV